MLKRNRGKDFTEDTYMTIKYPYLKLSLRYLHGAKSTAIFSYPASEPAVQAPINSAAIVEGFQNINEFYVTGCHSSRRFYSYVNVDDSNDNKDRLELTVSVESDVLISGRSLLNFFANVKGMLDNDETFNDANISNALEKSGFEEKPLRRAVAYTGNSLEGKPCYRQYISSSELAKLLTFPRQNAYATYSEVVFVPSTAIANLEKSLPQILQPITQIYAVICPEGVTASANNVELTDNLALTYRCPGFDPVMITVEAGTTSRYVRINGGALIVNNAEKAGIMFTQHVAYKVVSSKGGLVKTYTILINGRTATRGDGTFDITSTDFNNNGKVNITVSSTNYFTTTKDYTRNELIKHQPIELVIEPEELNVILRLDFGDGRTIEQQITLEKASTEYRALRAGSFHGFRAHRLMGGEPETYNVDITAASYRQPKNEIKESVEVLPTADEASDNSTPEVKKPKSASELRAERLSNNIPADKKPEQTSTDKEAETETAHPGAYAEDIPQKVDMNTYDPEEEEEYKHGKVSPMILAVVAVVLITCGIVWYLLTLLPSDNEAVQDDKGVDVSQTTDSTTQRITVTDDIPDETKKPSEIADSVTANKNIEEENADIAYLNDNNQWTLSNLKSEKYRNFFNLLSDGNIQEIAESDYFVVKDRATNSTAIKIVDLLWASKGTFAEKRISKELSTLKGKETIDITALYDRLSRMRDKQTNKEPRPQR